MIRFVLPGRDHHIAHPTYPEPNRICDHKFQSLDEILNSKHQITDKSQSPISNDPDHSEFQNSVIGASRGIECLAIEAWHLVLCLTRETDCCQFGDHRTSKRLSTSDVPLLHFHRSASLLDLFLDRGCFFF
jgi:hypothetical protein